MIQTYSKEYVDQLEAVYEAAKAYFNPRTDGGDEIEALSYATDAVQTRQEPPAPDLQNVLDQHDCGDVRFKQIEPWLYKCEGCGAGFSWESVDHNDPNTADSRLPCISCGDPDPKDGHVCKKWHGNAAPEKQSKD